MKSAIHRRQRVRKEVTTASGSERRGDGNDEDEHEGGETAASRALRGPSHTHVQRLDSSTRLNQNLIVLTNSIACRRLPSYICLCLCLHHHHRRRQSHLTAWPEYYRNGTYLSAFLFREIVTVNRTAFVVAPESRESTIKACKGNTPKWPSLAPMHPSPGPIVPQHTSQPVTPPAHGKEPVLPFDITMFLI